MNRIRKILPTCVSVALACFVPAIGAAQETKAQPEYDIVIRGGRVLDGAANLASLPMWPSKTGAS